MLQLLLLIIIVVFYLKWFDVVLSSESLLGLHSFQHDKQCTYKGNIEVRSCNVGRGTCSYIYRHGHIQTEDLLEESLHFITAQSGLTTLAVKYPNTLRFAQFKMHFNIVLLKEIMSIFYSL
jgi:hypothetical protein